MTARRYVIALLGAGRAEAARNGDSETARGHLTEAQGSQEEAAPSDADSGALGSGRWSSRAIGKGNGNRRRGHGTAMAPPTEARSVPSRTQPVPRGNSLKKVGSLPTANDTLGRGACSIDR